MYLTDLRRLSDASECLLAKVGPQGLAETNGSGTLALTQRSGVNTSHHHIGTVSDRGQTVTDSKAHLYTRQYNTRDAW